MTERPPIRIALVEDSDFFASEVCEFLKLEPGITCVAVCPTATVARAQLPALAPDVVLLDLRLPDGNGADLLSELCPAMPQTDFVVLTVFNDGAIIETAIRNGAVGYLLKRSGGDQIVRAVQLVREGGIALDDEISRSVLALLRKQPKVNDKLPGLTEQENRLLRELSLGASVKEAASTLGVTYASARTYVRRMYAKLGVHSRTEATRRLLNLATPGSAASAVSRDGNGQNTRTPDAKLEMTAAPPTVSRAVPS